MTDCYKCGYRPAKKGGLCEICAKGAYGAYIGVSSSKHPAHSKSDTKRSLRIGSRRELQTPYEVTYPLETRPFIKKDYNLQNTEKKLLEKEELRRKELTISEGRTSGKEKEIDDMRIQLKIKEEYIREKENVLKMRNKELFAKEQELAERERVLNASWKSLKAEHKKIEEEPTHIMKFKNWHIYIGLLSKFLMLLGSVILVAYFVFLVFSFAQSQQIWGTWLVPILGLTALAVGLLLYFVASVRK